MEWLLHTVVNRQTGAVSRFVISAGDVPLAEGEVVALRQRLTERLGAPVTVVVRPAATPGLRINLGPQWRADLFGAGGDLVAEFFSPRDDVE